MSFSRLKFFKSLKGLFFGIFILTQHINSLAQTCGSLEFNANINTAVKLPASNQYYTAANGGFTWECWFKLNQLPGGTNDIPLISAIDSVTYEDIMLGFGWHGGLYNQPVTQLVFKVDGPNMAVPSSPLCSYAPMSGFLINTWYHAAGVMDYAQQKFFLYLNGLLVDSRDIQVQTNTRTIETRLGECASCGLNNTLNGNMDEVRIWTKPLTAIDIYSQYYKCLSASQSNLLAYYHCNQSNTATTVTDATSNNNTGVFIAQQGWSAQQVAITTGTNCPSCFGPAAPGPPVICAGTNYVITAGNTSSLSNPSFSMQPGSVTNTTGLFPVGPLVTTSYTTYITGTNSLNITVTQSAVTNVTVYPQPLVSITATQTSCTSTLNGFSMGLSFNPPNATPGYTVSWWPAIPNGILNSSQLSVAAGSVAPGVYQPFIIADGGCATFTSFTIDPLPPLPTFTISSLITTTLTCLYPAVPLAAVSNYTYNGHQLNYYWSSTTFTANTQLVTIVNPGTYSVIVTDPVTSCIAMHTIAISLNNTPPISSVNPVTQIIGCGPGVVATTTGTATSPTVNVLQSWYFPGSPVPYNSNGPISIVSPPVGTSTYIVTDLINGCSTSKTIEVISNGGTYPTFSLTSITNFTLGCGTSSLSAITITNGQVPPNGGAVSYTILTPAFTGTTYGFTTTTTYSLNTPGIYTVIVKSNNNACETRLPLSIIQNTFAPNVGVTIPTQTLSCDIPSLTLLGTSTSTDAIDYLWKFNASPPSSVGYSITVHTTTAGASVASGTVIDNYTLVVTNENNNCTNFTVVPMYQNTRPPLALIGGGPATLTCLYSNINLSNISSTGILPGSFPTAQPIIGLLWEGLSPQLPKPNSSSYAAFTPGIYTLTARDENNGCTSRTTTPVYDGKVYPVLSTNTLVALDCGASATGGVKLPVTVVGLPASAVTAQWNVPVPSPNVQGLQTLTLTTDGIGEYNLVVTTTSNNCQAVAYVTVANGVLNADFTADQQSGYAPLTVNFTNLSSSTSPVNGTSSITTVWSFGNGITKTTSLNSTPVSAIYNQAGTYTVTMFASKGSCLDTAFKIITVDIPSKLEVPNVFTPNGDNSNDLFFLKTANLTNITALIYDRWGNKVYELSTDQGNIAWDGKNQSGKEVPDGTYFYIIKATGRDGQSYDARGNVSLYR